MAKIYFNQMQREAALYRANKTVICAGRGTGKGLLHAAFVLENFQMMPRSTTAFVAPNAKRALTNTLPSMFAHWENWGYKRGVHWVVGQKPPKELRWPDPLFKPENYDNIISFYTGAIGQIISQDRSGTSNSKSFDFLDIDEAKYIDYEQLKSETFPANRGQVAEFGHLPFHHGMLITSDMPVTKKGSWFLQYEKECDPETLSCIRALLAEQWHLKDAIAETPTYYLRRRLQDVTDLLSKVRRHATFFGRYSSLTNIEVLGEAWFRQMKRDLPPIEFRTSILCLPVDIVKDGFYSSMKPSHRYNATDFHYLDSLGYDTERLTNVDSRLDADLQKHKPLCIAFDYNANINCLVVGQTDEAQRRLNVVKSFYVKYERKLQGLIQDFCRYYYTFPNKEVIFYFDSTALGSNYAVNNEDFRWVIIHELEAHGWLVRPVFIGRPMGHLEKQLLINRGFDGRARLMPFFNEQNNESLLISVQTAGVYNGHKDKRLEKTPETEESRLEERTDFSDAFDTLYIGCERFPQDGVVYPVTSDW